MTTFRRYVQARDAVLAEGLYDDWVPFGVERPSNKIGTCKDHVRRLVRKFRPRIAKTAPVAVVRRPKVQPMRWGPVR